MLTVLVSSIITAGCLAGTSHGPSSDDRARPRGVVSSTDTIAISRDAYLGPDPDDYWKGTTDSLVVDGARSTRILIGVSQPAIAAVVGSGTLVNATLELAVRATDGSWPSGGATVDAHRVLQDWTEADVTWVCSDGHTVWDMSTGAGTIWHASHTARTTITNGHTGVVRLDVTADVAAFLAGTQPNYGWLIKRTAEGVGEPGRISFASHEGVPAPRLILEVTSSAGAWPVLAGRLPAFESGPVAGITAPDGSTESYLRTGASLWFEVGTTDAQKEAVVSQFGLTVLGATNTSRQHLFVTFADRGPTYAELAAFLDSLQNHPSVAAVLPILVSPVKEIADARFPTDGSGQGRSDWIGGSTSKVTADTSRPVVPDSIVPPANPLTVISTTNPDYVYYRNVFSVSFDDTTSGATVRAFMANFNAQIIGGYAVGGPLAGYVIQIPDPGETFAAVDSVQDLMHNYPGVRVAGSVTYGSPLRLRGRYPTDPGTASTRAKWFDPPILSSDHGYSSGHPLRGVAGMGTTEDCAPVDQERE